MNDIQPSEDPKEIIQTGQVRKEIARQKDRAIVPALTELASEVERRAESGQLAKELKKLNVSSLLGNLTRIVSAIKENAPQIVINSKGAPAQDPSWLRAHSATELSPHERALRRNKIIEAESSKGDKDEK